MARTENEIIAILSRYEQCFYLEDARFFALKEHSDIHRDTHSIVILNQNADLINEVKVPFKVHTMIRLENGNFALSNDEPHALRSGGVWIYNDQGMIQTRMPLAACHDKLFDRLPDIIPLKDSDGISNGFMAYENGVRRPHDSGLKKYSTTPEVCVETIPMPEVLMSQPGARDRGMTHSNKSNRPLVALDNGNIVMYVERSERVFDGVFDEFSAFANTAFFHFLSTRFGANMGPMQAPVAASNHKLDEGRFIKIFSPDLQTEVATLTLKSLHPLPDRGRGFRDHEFNFGFNCRAKICMDRSGQPMLAIAYKSSETLGGVQVKIYDLENYRCVHEMKAYDPFLDPAEKGAFLMSDYGLQKCLEEAGYPLDPGPQYLLK